MEIATVRAAVVVLLDVEVLRLEGFGYVLGPDQLEEVDFNGSCNRGNRGVGRSVGERVLHVCGRRLE